MTFINNITNKFKGFLAKESVHYLFLFFIISLALYASSLTYPYFVFDDYINLSGNPRIPPQSFHDILYFWSDSNTPLAYNIWQFFSLVLTNGTAAGFRLVNILTHALNCVLVFYLFKKLWPQNVRFDNRLSLSLFAALVFCFHPTHVESLVWVSNSRGVLATFFFLLALWRYLDIRSSRVSFDLKTFLLFLAACLTKPSAIVFPGFIFFIERHIYKANPKQAFLSLHLYIYPVLGLAFIHIKDLINLNFYNVPFLYRIFNSLQALQHYLLKTFFPFNLKFNYQLGPYDLLAQGIDSATYIVTVYIGLIFLAFLLKAFFNKTVQSLDFFVVLFFISIFPTIGFFPFDFQNISTVSDRYHYLAIIPFCWFCANFIRKRAFQVPILIILFFLSFNRVLEWSSQEYILTNAQKISTLDHKMLGPLTRVWLAQNKCEEIYNLEYESNHILFFESDEYLWPLYECINKTGHYKIARQHAQTTSINSSNPWLTRLIAKVYLESNLINKFYYQANILASHSERFRNEALSLLDDARSNWDQTTKNLYIQLNNQYLIHSDPLKSELFIKANRFLFSGPLYGLEDELHQKRENFVLFHKN